MCSRKSNVECLAHGQGVFPSSTSPVMSFCLSGTTKPKEQVSMSGFCDFCACGMVQDLRNSRVRSSKLYGTLADKHLRRCTCHVIRRRLKQQQGLNLIRGARSGRTSMKAWILCCCPLPIVVALWKLFQLESALRSASYSTETTSFHHADRLAFRESEAILG